MGYSDVVRNILSETLGSIKITVVEAELKKSHVDHYTKPMTHKRTDNPQ